MEKALIEARAKKTAIEADKLTGDNIFRILMNFDRLFDAMNEEERRQLVTELIAEIQVYEEPQANGQWLKSIKFRLPIIDGDISMSLECDDHVETVVQLSREHIDDRIKIDIDVEALQGNVGATASYEDIKAYVLEHSGLKVSSLYIAQVKEKYGLKERVCYNKPKSENARQPKCPEDKEKAIVEALRFCGMIE